MLKTSTKVWEVLKFSEGPVNAPPIKAVVKLQKNRDVVNLKMAKEILKFHGMIVPIGSGESVTTFSSL